MMPKRKARICLTIILLMLAACGSAEPFDLTAYTADGGQDAGCASVDANCAGISITGDGGGNSGNFFSTLGCQIRAANCGMVEYLDPPKEDGGE